MSIRKNLIIGVAAALALAGIASAQITGSGTLTITANVQSSISLVFDNDGAGKALSTGVGTSTATLAFGNVGIATPTGGGITVTPGSGNFTVSSPVDVKATLSNGANADYTLTALLGVADAVNTWKIGSNTLDPLGVTPTSLTATGAWNTDTPYTIGLTIPSTSAAGLVSDTINFTATAN